MAANLQLLFVQADNATSLAHKLADSMFFKRNGGVPVVENHNVRCSFGNPVSRQKLLQACSENFKKYQVKDATLKYAQHCVVEPPPTEAAPVEPAPAEPAPAEAAPSVAPPNLILAKRTSVADIKELAVGLTQAECHSLAVYFALCGVKPVQDSNVAAILEVKRKAAVAFKSPVESWVSKMQEHIPMSFSPAVAKQCNCRCGCTNLTLELSMCMPITRGYQAAACIGDNQNRLVCAQSRHWNGGCHMCAKMPKRVRRPLPPLPTVAVQPLEWYFNAPEGMPWVTRTRDVALDPRLLRVEEVFKTAKLENKARHARPFGWQNSLRAQCVFADLAGGQATVTVRWAAFLENPAWCQLEVAAYIHDWLPDNLG